MDILIFGIILTLLLIGLFGVFFPILPGIPFMFIVILVYSIIDKFSHVGAINLIVLGAITFLSLFVDYMAGFFGARFCGASRKGALGGLAGSILGVFVFPPFGLFIGLFLGVLLAEKYFNNSKLQQSTKAAGGAIIGSLAGILTNLILGIFFITYFIVSFYQK